MIKKLPDEVCKALGHIGDGKCSRCLKTRYEIEAYGALPCSTEKFIVNGISAESDDFGGLSDEDSENAEDYGCGNMTFIAKPSTEEVLLKYDISSNEYNKIASELETKLSPGSCGWCV